MVTFPNSVTHPPFRASSIFITIQGISMRPSPGLVNFAPAVAYLFCLNLPAEFSQPGNDLIEIPCIFTRSLLCFSSHVSLVHYRIFAFFREVEEKSREAGRESTKRASLVYTANTVNG